MTKVSAEQLLTLLKVAETGSLSEAASQLGLTQPAVSSQMKALAEAAGEPLWKRHRYGVELNSLGQSLLGPAGTVAAALSAAEQLCAEHLGLGTGELRLAASGTPGTYLLPSWLARFHRAHPGVLLTVRSANSGGCLRQLQAGEVDLALVENPRLEIPAGFQRRTVGYDRLILVVPPGHPWAGRAVDLRELGEAEMLWREQGSGSREIAWQALTEAGIRPKAFLTLSGPEAVKEAVHQGLGVAFLSEISAREELASGRLQQAHPGLSGLERPLWLIAPRRGLRRAALGFLELLEGAV